MARSVYSVSKGQRFFVSNMAHFDLDAARFQTDNDREEAEEILKKNLTDVLVPAQSNRRGEKANGLLPDELVWHALEDRHPLLSMFYALTHGKWLTNEGREALADPNCMYMRSDYLACFAAKELLVSAGNYNKLTTLQASVGEICYSFGADEATMQFLGRFRLSGSISHLKRQGLAENVHSPPHFLLGTLLYIVSTIWVLRRKAATPQKSSGPP